MNRDVFKKIIMLNVAQDGMWFCFAILMVTVFGVPWYIGLMPIALNMGIFFYGANLARKNNSINPRNDDREILFNNNVQEIDDLLYNISLMEPREYQ